MNELITIKVSELKENKEFSRMVPEMSDIEYNEFLKSIEKDGIRQPIHILLDKTILDGRHRVRACKDLNIQEIQALVHNFDEDEAIEFVRDTAIERRNITKVQRVDIILRSEDLIKSIEEEARKRMVKGKKATLVSADTEVKESKRTNQSVADMAGVGSATVARMRRIQKESPEDYKAVVESKKPVKTAYNELPTVKSKEAMEMKRKNNETEHKVKTLTEEEARLKMAYDNLELNLRQLNFYVEKNQSHLIQAIEQKMKDDEEFMNQSEKTMKNILELMKAYKEENKK